MQAENSEALQSPTAKRALDAWPAHDGLDDEVAEAEIGWVIDLITAIRSVRVEMNIPAATMLPLVLAHVPATAELAAASLLLVAGLHQFGAAIWIGGIPSFLLALGRIHNGQGLRLVGARFSRMSMVGVACILVSGVTMWLLYVGDWQGFYGTAYGVMVGAKIAEALQRLKDST